MANRKVLWLWCGLFLLSVVQPSLQGGVYVPPGAGLGPGGAGLYPGSAGGVPAGYKPAKPVGEYNETPDLLFLSIHKIHLHAHLAQHKVVCSASINLDILNHAKSTFSTHVVTLFLHQKYI